MPQNRRSRENNGLEPMHNLRGWPGYRNRADRSGLDYLDTVAEEAHMEGLFWRNLFTPRLRTRNPFYLFMMLLGALCFMLPLVLAIAETISGGRLELLMCFLPFAVPGFLLLINMVLSFRH